MVEFCPSFALQLGDLLRQGRDLLLELSDALVAGTELGLERADLRLELLDPIVTPVAPHGHRNARMRPFMESAARWRLSRGASSATSHGVARWRLSRHGANDHVATRSGEANGVHGANDHVGA